MVARKHIASPMLAKAELQKRFYDKPNLIKIMLGQATQDLLDGDTESFKSGIKECVNGTIGYQELANVTGINDKSLMRMFSEAGNPSIFNCTAVICALCEHNGIKLTVKTGRSG